LPGRSGTKETHAEWRVRTRAALRFSATVLTHDQPLLFALRGIAYYSESQEGLGRGAAGLCVEWTGFPEWEDAGHCATFYFSEQRVRAVFVEEALGLVRRAPWRLVGHRDNDPQPEKPTRRRLRGGAAGSRSTTTREAATNRPQQTVAKKSKLDQIVQLMRRPGGVTVIEICNSTGWQHHTVASALSKLRKRRRLSITREREDKSGNVKYSLHD